VVLVTGRCVGVVGPCGIMVVALLVVVLFVVVVVALAVVVVALAVVVGGVVRRVFVGLFLMGGVGCFTLLFDLEGRVSGAGLLQCWGLSRDTFLD